MRVQIPAYTDRWMMGDRYGEVVQTPKRQKKAMDDRGIVYVKLDISGKTMRFLLADCTVV